MSYFNEISCNLQVLERFRACRALVLASVAATRPKIGLRLHFSAYYAILIINKQGKVNKIG